MRRSAAGLSIRLNFMRAALARGSFSTIRSMAATRMGAGASRDAIIRPTCTIVSPSLTTQVLAAAFNILLSTTTVCGHRDLPSGAVGHHGRVTRILAMDALPRTAVIIALTASLMSVSGLVDASRNSMTTCFEDALGTTATGGYSVLGQLLTERRLRPPDGAAGDESFASSIVARSTPSPPLASPAGPSTLRPSPKTDGVGGVVAPGRVGGVAANKPKELRDAPDEEGAAAGAPVSVRGTLADEQAVAKVAALGGAAPGGSVDAVRLDAPTEGDTPCLADDVLVGPTPPRSFAGARRSPLLPAAAPVGVVRSAVEPASMLSALSM